MQKRKIKKGKTMQIVIDIPKDYYKECVDAVKNKKNVFYITKWIAKGIPLSKGHGRLIDAEILIKDMKNGINAGLLIDGYEKYTNINSVDDCIFCVECADTVLEADKEI